VLHDGREVWLREGRRELAAKREREPWPVPRSRSQRLLEARRRMDEELAYEHAANRAFENYRATGRRSDGRRFGKPPKPYSPPLVPEGRINVTDPDSREMRTQGQPNIQGYNAQAVVTEQQIIVAAEISSQSPDFGQLEPMVSAALRELEHAGIDQRPRTVLADAGYWHKNQIEQLFADGFQVLVPPDSMVRENRRPGREGGLYDFMRRVLKTDLGREPYIKRRHTIEPAAALARLRSRRSERCWSWLEVGEYGVNASVFARVVGEVEFAKDAADVSFDRFVGDEELFADAAVGAPLRH